MHDFPVDCNSIDKSDILNVHKYLMTKNKNKIMFSIIKQVFIKLLSFSEYLATKYLFLNDETCMVRPTLIDMNSVKLKYYPLMISLNKHTGSCNVLSPNICVLKETKKHKC